MADTTKKGIEAELFTEPAGHGVLWQIQQAIKSGELKPYSGPPSVGDMNFLYENIAESSVKKTK